MTFEIVYEVLAKNINTNLNKTDLGDVIHLIHEPMSLQFQTRILEVTDYPLQPQLKPIFTISSQQLEKIDKQTATIIDKANSDREINTIKANQSEFAKRIEKTIEAVAD